MTKLSIPQREREREIPAQEKSENDEKSTWTEREGEREMIPSQA